MKYTLYIKSHCEAPDWEDEVEAESKQEAMQYFLKRINFANEDPWTEGMLKEYIRKVYA
jgi:hypothetical protein